MLYDIIRIEKKGGGDYIVYRICKGKYTDYDLSNLDDNGHFKYTEFDFGYFYDWHNDLAIVKLLDGQIVKVQCDNIQFLDTKNILKRLIMIYKMKRI